jgi:drug/metabolite transporter (DMT)-like permease
MVGVVFALAAALSWGAGDFYGGLASRKITPFQVLLLTASSSLLLLILFALFRWKSLPSPGDVVLAVIAGVSGALGLAALYRGLGLENAALVASVAGVIGVIVPTLVGLFLEGLPSDLTLVGSGLSIPGIWLVSQPKDGGESIAKAGLVMALLAGIGFGAFLALIAQIEGEEIFVPLVFSKLDSLVLAVILIQIRRLPPPKPAQSPITILSGFLDAGGNILHLFATQFARLDIGAVLSSLYPVGTVLLANLILKERFSNQQKWG